MTVISLMQHISTNYLSSYLSHFSCHSLESDHDTLPSDGNKPSRVTGKTCKPYINTVSTLTFSLVPCQKPNSLQVYCQ